ncbi:hypothetical protein HVX40_24365 (plasmid) [Escherichia coli]|nr:hypothetical protein [Escherichia coli]MBA8354138.1 hypothetical protein [Escherichia coli]
MSDTPPRTKLCQVKLTEKAVQRLETFQSRLSSNSKKMSKSDIINLILSKMTAEEMNKILLSIDKAAKARQKVMEIYKNSDMTKEDLEDVLSRLP